MYSVAIRTTLAQPTKKAVARLVKGLKWTLIVQLGIITTIASSCTMIIRPGRAPLTKGNAAKLAS